MYVDCTVVVILPAALWSLGPTHSLTELSTTNTPGGKGRLTRMTDCLAAVCCLDDPQPHGPRRGHVLQY
jgi:hypothetical protein